MIELFRRKKGTTGSFKNGPVCASEYNKFMGSVDQCNSLRSSYSMHLTHHYRWYMCLIYYCFDMLLVNSFIFYKYRSGLKISQKEYRVKLIKSLRALGTTRRMGYTSPFSDRTKKRRRSGFSSSSSPCSGTTILRNDGGTRASMLKIMNQKFPMRLVNVGDHLVETTKGDHRLNCKRCYADDGSQHQVVTYCQTCKVALCCNSKQNCFNVWHSRSSNF